MANGVSGPPGPPEQPPPTGPTGPKRPTSPPVDLGPILGPNAPPPPGPTGPTQTMVTITRSGDTLTQEIPVDQADQAQARHDDLAATGKLTDDHVAVLDPPPSPASLATGLLAYSSNQRWQKEVGGITVNGIYMPTDEQTQYTLTGAVTMIQVAPDTTIQWKIADGTFVTLPGTQLVMLAQAVATHVQNCFSTEATLATGIQASPPTITTRAQIDEAYAAIVTTINTPAPGMSSAAQMDGVAAVDFRST